MNSLKVRKRKEFWIALAFQPGRRHCLSSFRSTNAARVITYVQVQVSRYVT